jgi:predicted metal-dependent peptidase
MSKKGFDQDMKALEDFAKVISKGLASGRIGNVLMCDANNNLVDLSLDLKNLRTKLAGKSDEYVEGYTAGAMAAEHLTNSGGTSTMFNHFFDSGLDELLSMPADDANIALSEAEAQLKETVTKAAQETLKARGTIPGHLEDLIKKLSQSTVNWIALLRNAIINAIRTNKKRSMKRPNRRSFGIPGGFHFPGKSKDKTFSVVFLVDTSGSMGNEELGQAIGELETLRKVNKSMTITVIEADVVIHKEYELEVGQEVQRNMLGRRGTDFNLALARAKELNPGICFYFTDGFGGEVQIENRVKCPFYWIVTPNGTQPDSWGRCIYTKAGGANVPKKW